MRVFGYGLGFALALGLGVGLASGGCAAGSQNRTASGTGAGSTGGSTGHGGGAGLTTTSGSSSSNGSSGVALDAGFDGFGSCATFSASATQAPAAMLIVLQGSASMCQAGKWTAAEQAIISAIDLNVFDTMSLGFTSFPKGTTTAPACLDGIFPSVYCSFYEGTASDPLPVPIAPAGTNKSSASSGVRHDILGWLNSHTPACQDGSDSSPVYDAMNAGYQVLQATNIAKRIMVLITDGGFDCTSVSNPTRPGISDGLCPDWEIPTTVNTLITNMRTSTTAPVDTFVVGVPGSDTTPNQGGTAAPYYMELALSTYAVSGSPTTVPATCDKTAVWTQTGAPPVNPCHIDLSGANFNASALADAIAQVRSQELGCTYDLPTPPAGETIDPTQVNVVEVINGKDYPIPKRANPAETCTGQMPCWDYDASGKVILVGSACTAVQGSTTATVDIYVGCATITQ